MSVEQAEVRQLKEGRFMVVDEEPCKILSITTSKPGKHGAAKARIDVVGLFDGKNRSVVYSTGDKVKVPIIDKRKAQVVSAHGTVAQLMDLESYEQFELPIPEELSGQLNPGGDIMYMEAMGRRMITKA
ncbi:MAG: translation initiation factor IF-5A [Thermoplasmatota archaeon]